MSHGAELIVPLFTAVIAFGLWFGCFVAIERLQSRATGHRRPFPVNELHPARHAVWALILTTSAALVYALVGNALVVLSIVGAYGLTWAAGDRDKISRRFDTWSAGVAVRLQFASVVASVVARVAYVLAAALLAIAVVKAIRG